MIDRTPPSLFFPHESNLTRQERAIANAIKARLDACMKRVGERVTIKGEPYLVFKIASVKVPNCGIPAFTLIVDKDDPYYRRGRFRLLKMKAKGILSGVVHEAQLNFI